VQAAKHRRVGLDVEVIGIHNGVIHPSTTFRTVWDLVLGVFVVFTVLVVPYRIAFSQVCGTPQGGPSFPVEHRRPPSLCTLAPFPPPPVEHFVGARGTALCSALHSVPWRYCVSSGS
jgi:hypothetical protein